ncbi:hypothetical protein DFQ13_102336 [Actinokineospora spheciospongiae]|nr:hypothetical protein DFQ13_102336 [Actinokineospora spheciospongiae]
MRAPLRPHLPGPGQHIGRTAVATPPTLRPPRNTGLDGPAQLPGPAGPQQPITRHRAKPRGIAQAVRHRASRAAWRKPRGMALATLAASRQLRRAGPATCRASPTGPAAHRPNPPRSGLTQPTLTRFDLGQPAPTSPARPARPDQPGPTSSAWPARPGPARPGPARPGPARPGPTSLARPARPGLADLARLGPPDWLGPPCSAPAWSARLGPSASGCLTHSPHPARPHPADPALPGGPGPARRTRPSPAGLARPGLIWPGLAGLAMRRAGRVPALPEHLSGRAL